MEKLTERIQVLLTASERKKIEARATREDRSLTYVCRALILKGLAK